VPLLYTVIETGMTSGASLFLLMIAVLFYFRLDFHFISVQIKDKNFFLRKGLFIFKNRRKVAVPLSQLISLRLNGNDGDDDCDIIYYDGTNTSFYSESIATGKVFDNEFVNDAISNKIAVFKR